MKKSILLLLFLLVSVVFVIAATERNDFSEGESYLLRDKNITVLSLDTDKDKAVVCVNGVKGIVDDGDVINGVYFDVNSASGHVIKLEMTYSCSGNCFCDGDECSNQKCFPSSVGSDDDSEDDEVIEEPVVVPSSNAVKEVKVVRSSQESKVSVAPVLFVGLLILLVLVLLVGLIKRK